MDFEVRSLYHAVEFVWGANYSLLTLVQLSQLSRILSARHATSTVRHIAFSSAKMAPNRGVSIN